MGLALGALAFLGLLRLLAITGIALAILTIAGKVVMICGIIWTAWSLTDLVSHTLTERVQKTETTFDDMIIPLLRNTVKLFIIVMGVIYIANSLKIELAPLLASFGLAGLAVSFASRDTVANLFGGLTIFLDRPFKIGERIKFKGYDGVVEEIGFRSTRVRTASGHLVTIPNGNITSEPVENVARRKSLRRVLNLTIPNDTPRKKILKAVQFLRDILEEDDLRGPIHAVIDGNELQPRVHFDDFNSDSLNINVIYCYAPPAWWDYLDHAQRVNLRIMEEFEKSGIEFAFPSQTLFLAGDPKRELALRNLSNDVKTKPVPRTQRKKSTL